MRESEVYKMLDDHQKKVEKFFSANFLKVFDVANKQGAYINRMHEFVFTANRFKVVFFFLLLCVKGSWALKFYDKVHPEKAAVQA